MYQDNTDNYSQSTLDGSEGIETILKQLSKVDILNLNRKGSSSFDNKDTRDRDNLINNIRACINKSGSEAGYIWFEVFKAVYQGRVELNAWTGELVFDGQIATPESLIDRLEQSLKMMMKLNREQFDRKFQVWIQAYTFKPIRRQIEEIIRNKTTKWVFPMGADKGHYEHSDLTPMADWDNLAKILFGTEDKLSQMMLEKWLISAVVRAYQPGCQADYSLVLKGKQGAGKSTFFRVLGGEYFLDLDNSTDGTETKRQLDRSWIVEMGEMEGITRKKEVEELKAFLTKTKDTFRGLYERKPSDHLRHCVFGGTCNSDEILRDSTGNRRFWIIDLGDRKVNTDYLKVNREDILATAYLKWTEGCTWYPNEDMSEQSEERNKDYSVTNEWLQKVINTLAKLQRYVDSQNDSQKVKNGYEPYDGLSISLHDFMELSLNIHPGSFKSYEKKVKEALEELGYTKMRKTIGGSRVYVYIKPDTRNPYLVEAKSLEQLSECWK